MPLPRKAPPQGDVAVRILAGVRHFVWRWTRRAFLSLFVLLGLLLALLALLQLTPSGRALVLKVALDQTNQLIPGAVEAEELTRLSIFGIELREVRAFNPEGTEVAHLGHLSVVTDLAGLLRGRIALRNVVLERGVVDARVLEARKGLLAAFVDPDAPESPPNDAPPPTITISDIVMRDVTVRLPPLESLGQIDVSVQDLAGRFALIEGKPEVAMERLLFDAQRGAEVLLAVDLSANVPRDDSPATLALQARSGEMALQVQAEGVLPTQDGWQQRPVSAQLDLRGLRAKRLREVLQAPSLEEAFLGEISLHLTATGTPEELTVDGALDTPGGTLRFEELSATQDHLRAVLSTDGVWLRRLRSDLPDRKVALQVIAEASGFPPAPVHFSGQVREAALDDTRLADADLTGTYQADAFTGIELALRDGASLVVLEGDARLSGAADFRWRADLRPQLLERLGDLLGQDLSGRVLSTARVTIDESGALVADGQLGVENLTLRAPPAGDSARLKSADLSFHLQGRPPDLEGRVNGKVEDASFRQRYLDEATFEVEGGLASLAVTLDARAGVGPVEDDPAPAAGAAPELHLNAHIERGADSTRLTGEGLAKLQGQSIAFDLAPTRISDAGRIQTDGITLRIAAQELHVEGELTPTGESAGIDLRFGPLDLAELRTLAGIEEDLVGTVTGQGRLEGSLAVPLVRFELEGEGLGLRAHPLADLHAQGHLDVRAGQAEVRLALSGRDQAGKQSLLTRLQVEATFPNGPGYAEALADSELNLNLDVETLDTAFLRPYLPSGALPMDAGLVSSVVANGTLAAPTLTAKSELRVRVAGEDPVILAHDLGYENGELETTLTVSDAQGPWLDMTAHLALPGDPPRVQDMGALLPRAADEGAWDLRLQAAERSLSAIPLVSLVMDPKEVPPFAASLRAVATHAPRAEPDVTLDLRLRQDHPWSLAECSTEKLLVLLSARHEGANNELLVRGFTSQRELLRLSVNAPLAVAPLLQGAQPDLGTVKLSLRTEKLQLSSLPFVCGRAHGMVTARIDGNDLLGPEPTIQAQVNAQSFRLGGRHGLNVDLTSEATSEFIRAELDIRGTRQYPDATGHIAARAPWTFREGKVALQDDTPLAVVVQLHELPIAPLLPPRGPISYPQGTLDGRVRVSGTVKSPELHGDLYLKDVAFTSTAIAQPLRDIQSHIVMDGRRLIVEHFEAHDRDGVLLLTGHVDVSDMNRIVGSMEIDAKDFPLRQRGQVVAVTSIEALAESTVTPNETRARLTLRDVDTWLESVAIRTGIDLGAHPEFVIDGQPVDKSDLAEPSPVKAGEKHDGFDAGKAKRRANLEIDDEKGQLVRILIDANQRFWVKRKDFAVKLSASLETVISEEDVRVTGDVRIDRGYLQLFGKVFDLSRDSTLRFIGSNPPNPVLELEAEHKTRGGSMVSVRITGRGDSPVLTFLIDGEEVDAGVAVQELFGGEKGGGNSDGSAQARGFVAGLTAGVLATAARRELGGAAPILMVDPSDQAGEGRLRAGFELDDIVPQFLKPLITGAYLEGIVAREAEGEASASTQFGALLEFYFPKRFFTAGQYGPGTTWSLDFGWQL